ncbi:hypothetical protein [Kushneria avicenniae]|uniref:hypothetical protein n=1 Tax=Kushneria avicenniae TaxID=402385 RepID=UPI00111366AD|nr:hypothetical protein [Kushneria avicenniae]
MPLTALETTKVSSTKHLFSRIGVKFPCIFNAEKHALARLYFNVHSTFKRPFFSSNGRAMKDISSMKVEDIASFNAEARLFISGKQTSI